MATKERVLAYFKECEVAQMFSAMTQGMANQMAQEFAQSGDLLGEQYFLDQGALYAHIQDAIFAHLADVYSNLYTDDEIDQLTAMYHLPISKRSRELMPQMLQQLGAAVADLEVDVMRFVLKREFSRLLDEATA